MLYPLSYTGRNSRGRIRTCDHPRIKRSNPGLSPPAELLITSQRQKASGCAIPSGTPEGVPGYNPNPAPRTRHASSVHWYNPIAAFCFLRSATRNRHTYSPASVQLSPPRFLNGFIVSRARAPAPPMQILAREQAVTAGAYAPEESNLTVR